MITPTTMPRRKIELVSMIMWFSSLTVILLLAAAMLASSREELLNDVVTWLTFAGGLCLGTLLVALVIVRRKNDFVWPRWTWRFAGLAVAGLASLMAAQLSFQSGDPAVTVYQASPLWLAAVFGALLAAWPRHEPRITAEPTPRLEWIILIGLLLLAFVLRVVNLHDLPILMGDESKFALEARRFNQLQLFRPFYTAIDGHWGLWFMVLGAFTRLLGETIEVIRLHSVIFGTLSILAAYALTRLLWGRRPALIAAALLATYHFHIHFSRNAMNNIYDALFSMLIFGLFWLGWLKDRRWPWLLGALALGVAQYFYIGGRVILAQLAVLGVFWLITDRRRVRAQLLNIALAVGVFAVITMPVTYFARLRFDDYMTRFNQTNILRNGWLEDTLREQHTGVLPVLGQQLRDTIQVFIAGPERFFYQGQSLLTPAMSVLACVSLLYLLRHFKEGRAFYVVSSLALILLIGGIFTLSPLGGAHHFVGAAPLIYIAIAVFIDRVLAWAGQRWPAHQRAWAAIGIGLIALLMVGDAYYYFGTFAENRPTFSADNEPAIILGKYLHDLEQQPKPRSVVCVRAPRMWCRHDTVLFLAPQLGPLVHDLTEPPQPADLTAPPGNELIVVVAPGLPDDLAVVQARFPAVASQEHYDDVTGQLVFTTFEVPAAP